MPSPWLTPIARYLASEAPFHPQDEIPLELGVLTGWVKPAVADALAALCGGRFRLRDGLARWQLAGADYAARSHELQAVLASLRQQGLVSGWRNEVMVLRQDDGRPWAAMERAAFRTLGLPTRSAHLNAMVQTADGARMWIARRSASKAVDPGCLDNLVGGGVTGLEGVTATLCREAVEEAGLSLRHPPAPQARLHVLRRTPHGVQDEYVYVHECWLGPDFRPANQDGEVAATSCLPLPEVLGALCKGHFTRDAALVILHGLHHQHFFGSDGAAVGKLLNHYGVPG